MPSSCSVVGCNARQVAGSNVKMFSLPTGRPGIGRHAGAVDPNIATEQRRRWIVALNRQSLPKRSYVCSRHFITGSPSTDPLHPDFSPSVHMGYVRPVPLRSPFKSPSASHRTKLARVERLRKRSLLLSVPPASTPDIPSSSGTVQQTSSDGVQHVAHVMDQEGFNDVASMTSTTTLSNFEDNDSDEHDLTSMASTSTLTNIEDIDFYEHDLISVASTTTVSNVDDVDMYEHDFPIPTSANTNDFVVKVHCGIQTEIALSKAEGNSIGVQTNIDGTYAEYMKSRLTAAQLQLGLAKLEVEKYRAQYMKIIPNIDSLKSDDETVLFLTGLPSFTLLEKVFNFVKESLMSSFIMRLDLSYFQVLLLTLMKLRKNYDFKDLGLRFGIHRTTASKYYHKTVVVLYQRLKFLVSWKSREDLQKGMPSCFTRSFGRRVVVIIDCFEARIETPAPLKAQYQTWSSYKHHNTVKFLIGVAPQGAVTFISPAYGGHASDAFIVQDCGILQKLLPNDIILSDKGFSIVEDVEARGAELKQPAFKQRGVNQMPKSDVTNSREISSSRVHVERMIGHLRQKYEILQQEKYPITLLVNYQNQPAAHIDMVVTICCALINLCPTIIEKTPTE